MSTAYAYMQSNNVSVSAFSAPDRWFTALLQVTGSQPHADAWQCPAHPDASPSLKVSPGGTGAVIHCRAGCSTADVLGVFGLGFAHLYEPPALPPDRWVRFTGITVTYPPVTPKAKRGRGQAAAHLEAVHDYGGGYQLERWRTPDGSKDLRWLSRNPKGEIVPGLLGRSLADIPLYRSRDLRICAATGDPLLVVESESSVDALNSTGIYATTWAGGAASPPLGRLAAELADIPTIKVVADHDEPGIRCAAKILAAIPHATGWLPPAAGTDVRDVLTVDRRLTTLIPLTRRTP